MEGKFFIEMGQLTNGCPSSSSSWETHKASNGAAHVKSQDDEEGDSDDEEETRSATTHLFTDGDETNSEKENSQRHRDSGIDSLVFLETGTPEDDNDDDDDQAFRPVVYSKRRRGSRGAEKSQSSPWSPNAPLTSSTPTSGPGRNNNKSDPDGSETEATAAETAKQKKKRKRKNKKRAASNSVDEHCADDWDQLDLVDDDAIEVRKIDASAKETSPVVNGMANSEKPTHAAASKDVAESPSKDVDKDDVFEERPSNGSFRNNGSQSGSFSESYDNKTGIKSILKNRSRTFSGESSCSEICEVASSTSGKRGSSLNGSCRKHSTSLTSVTQSLESLSIGSMLTSDSCCEDGLEDRCDHPQQYCASWSSGTARKSVHFSAVIDRKRFRSGAPPQNVGKGRRNSGGSKPNQREHGKKRHLSEGDAVSMGGQGDGLRQFDHAAVLNSKDTDGREESPSGDLVSNSSDDMFQMEELDQVEEEAQVKSMEVTGPRFQSLLGVPEEKEDVEEEGGIMEVALENGVGNRCEGKASKKGKKNKSKKNKGKSAGRSEFDSGDYEDQDVDGWSIVGNNKLGKKKNGSKNSSDLSLSDAEDGHSVYVTDGASDFGAISIMDVGGGPLNGQKVSQ